MELYRFLLPLWILNLYVFPIQFLDGTVIVLNAPVDIASV